MIKFANTFLLCVTLTLVLTAQQNSGWELTPVNILNTPGDEYAPQMGPAGLLYARNPVVGDQSVELRSELMYSAFRQNGQFSGRSFSEELSSASHEGSISIGPNGDFVIFSRNSQSGRSSRNYLYMSQIGVYDYQKATELPFNDPRFNTTHPALDQSGKRLIFASDRPGGFGGFDLYYAEYKQGQWSKPINLGSEVNSKNDEIFPFWGDHNQLTFSSDRPGGLGGLDLYLLDANDEVWSRVQHLGAPFSSEGDDKGITWSVEKGKGFISSNRDGGNGGDDLYSFTFSAESPISWMTQSPESKLKTAEVESELSTTAVTLNSDRLLDSIVYSNTIVSDRQISASLLDQINLAISSIKVEPGYQFTKIDLQLLSTQTPKAAREEAVKLVSSISKALPLHTSAQINASGFSVYSDVGRMTKAYWSMSSEARVEYELTLQKVSTGNGIGLNID